MKKLLLTFSLIFYFSGLTGATLHTFLVGDTLDPSIGGGIVFDLVRMRNEANIIALHCNLKHEVYQIDQDRARIKNVKAELNALQIEPDDIVFFYFSGHGYRTTKKDADLNPWPNLFFSLEQKGIDYLEVATIIAKKNPRLVFMMSDSCNSYINSLFAPALVSIQPRVARSESSKASNYRTLFLDHSGSVKITSSKAGQYSWGNMYGGMFTDAFLIGLSDEVSQTVNSADWEHLIYRSIVNLNYRMSGIDKEQNPFYEINLK